MYVYLYIWTWMYTSQSKLFESYCSRIVYSKWSLFPRIVLFKKIFPSNHVAYTLSCKELSFLHFLEDLISVQFHFHFYFELHSQFRRPRPSYDRCRTKHAPHTENSLNTFIFFKDFCSWGNPRGFAKKYKKLNKDHIVYWKKRLKTWI